MKKLLPVLFCLVLLLFSCHPGQHDDEQDLPPYGHSMGFRLTDHGSYRLLQVQDPWQGASGIRIKYILCGKQEMIPDSLRGLNWIKTPVKRVVCMSTTHVAMIESLQETSSIVGISGSDYISNPAIRKGLRIGYLRNNLLSFCNAKAAIGKSENLFCGLNDQTIYLFFVAAVRESARYFVETLQFLS